MRNSEILEIPIELIEETLKTTAKSIFKNQNGECVVYLKDFDYYWVLCITNTQNPLNNRAIKLPKEFVEKHFSSHKNLLDEFLKITGLINNFVDGSNLIGSFNHKELVLKLNLQTFNRIKYMTFGIPNGDMTDFFFCVDIVKYRDFLEEYQVKSFT